MGLLLDEVEGWMMVEKPVPLFDQWWFGELCLALEGLEEWWRELFEGLLEELLQELPEELFQRP